MRRSKGYLFGFMMAAVAFLSSQALAQEKLTYCASWIIYGQMAPMVSGIERGTFKAEGLDVSYVRGHGSGDTFRRVGTGACDFGDAGAGPAAIGRAKGIKAKLFAMMMPKFQQVLYYFADSGIKDPKDIAGKRVTGGPRGSSDILLWPLFAKVIGVDPEKVEVIYMEPGAKAASLVAGRVDVVFDFHSNLPSYAKVAKEAGKKLVFSLWADHGLDLYSNGLVAPDETLAKKKDLTLRFLRAHHNSLIWAFRNREASVDLFLKKYPEHNREASVQAQDLFFEHFFDGITEKEGFGRMNREKIARTIQITLESVGIKEKLDPEEIYTNEFLDQLPKEHLFFFKM